MRNEREERQHLPRVLKDGGGGSEAWGGADPGSDDRSGMCGCLVSGLVLVRMGHKRRNIRRSRSCLFHAVQTSEDPVSSGFQNQNQKRANSYRRSSFAALCFSPVANAFWFGKHF